MVTVVLTQRLRHDPPSCAQSQGPALRSVWCYAPSDAKAA